MPRVLQWMATSSLEEIGGAGEAVGWLFTHCFDCIETTDDDDKVKCLWVKIKEKVSKLYVLVGICYRPLNQGAQGDGAFYSREEAL